MGIFDIFSKKEKTPKDEKPKDDEDKPDNCMPEVTVEWDCCNCVTVTSTKDLSNVVLDL